MVPYIVILAFWVLLCFVLCLSEHLYLVDPSFLTLKQHVRKAKWSTLEPLYLGGCLASINSVKSESVRMRDGVSLPRLVAHQLSSPTSVFFCRPLCKIGKGEGIYIDLFLWHSMSCSTNHILWNFSDLFVFFQWSVTSFEQAGSLKFSSRDGLGHVQGYTAGLSY